MHHIAVCNVRLLPLPGYIYTVVQLGEMFSCDSFTGVLPVRNTSPAAADVVASIPMKPIAHTKPLVEDSRTWKLHELIDWQAASRKRKGLYRWEQTHGGEPEPYARRSMFKLMLLEQ